MNATTTTRRRGILIFVGLAISLMFLIACSTDPTTTTGAVNSPTGSQTSLSQTSGGTSGAARDTVGDASGKEVKYRWRCHFGLRQRLHERY
jgi:hypothetical protein